MPPKEENSPVLRMNYALYDKKHWLTHRTVHTIPLRGTLQTFNTNTIWQLLRYVQTQHRKQDCALCPGPIIVKSAWAVRIPANATAERLPDPLEHNPKGNMTFMEPASLISEYIDINSCDADMIDVLFESTFDVEACTSNESPAKRPLELVDSDPTRAAGSSKRAKVEDPAEAPRPKGIRVVPTIHPSSSISLPPLSFILSAILETPGTIFVDKSSYIPAFTAILNNQPGITTLPPGTGKTGIMWMLSLWFDWSIPLDIHEKIFMLLDIGPRFKEARSKLPADSQLPYSARRHLCLVFDLGPVQFNGSTDGTEISRCINKYCCQVIQQFVQKYKDQLGSHIFSAHHLHSPANMMAKIQAILIGQFKSDRTKQHTLFIGVDHVDAPLLRFLESTVNRGGSYIAESIGIISNTLDSLLKSLWQVAGANNMHRSKLLINSNLPYHPGMPDIKPQNISALPSLHGAFGMSPNEVAGLFSVLSRPDQVLDLDAPNMPSDLGVFSPPLLTPGDAPPLNLYTFKLVLHHVARVLQLDSEHKNPPSWPLLSEISKSPGCKHLLQYSNLRRLRPVFLAPPRELSQVKLAALDKSEEILWTVLFSVGVLAVTDEGNHRSDPLWSLLPSNPLARQQLFSGFSDISKDELNESNRDRQLRSLLERNPTPLTDVISKRLQGKARQDLYKMSEATFQVIFEEYMGHPRNDSLNPPLPPPYRDNFFGQIGLLTDFTKKKVIYSEQGKGNVEASGEGRFGYMDIGWFGLKRLHPGRVIAGELKYLSLFGFIRVEYSSEKEYMKAVLDNKNCSFEEHCEKKAKFLRSLSLEKLRTQPYGRYENKQLVKRTVGEILKAAEKQLSFYLNALVDGKTNTEQNKNGITRAERRVNVRPGQDEVVGMIFCGVGADIVAICMDTRQTTYEYMGRAAKSIYD